MSNIVYLVTLPNGYFISAGQSWLSIDVNYLECAISDRGYTVVRITIDKLAGLDVYKDDFLIYTSSPEEHIREYIKNSLYFFSGKCNLIPKYEFLLAHEDKGFQEILKRELEIKGLSAFYHYDIDAYSHGNYPVVFKTVDGAGSAGVELVKNESERISIKRKLFSLSLFRSILLFMRWLKLSKDEFNFYKYRHKGFRPFILQEFVEGLECDYKILIFSDRYFGLKRYTKKNDFRASGSGYFNNESEIPEDVLNYSAFIFDKMKVPFLSLDIAYLDECCYLIEYQVLNFGPLTLTSSKFHYWRKKESWVKVEGKASLDENYAHAYADYLSKF